MQGAALADPTIRQFWRCIQTLDSKDDVIRSYETTLLQTVTQKAGLSADILFSYKNLGATAHTKSTEYLNPTHQLWEHLITRGFPFIKSELLYRNPVGLPLHHWDLVVSNHGGDVQMIKDHLALLVAQRMGFSVAEDFEVSSSPVNYKKFRMLRRIVGDRMFFATRAALARRRQKHRNKGRDTTRRDG